MRLTRSESLAFNVMAREFDLPFSIPEAQRVAAQANIGTAVTKKTVQRLVGEGELEHVGMDGERKLWWWAGEEILATRLREAS